LTINIKDSIIILLLANIVGRQDWSPDIVALKVYNLIA